MNYVAPDVQLKSFTCPHCNIVARQYRWGYQPEIHAGALNENQLSEFKPPIKVTKCEHCSKVCLWFEEKLVFPESTPAPPANTDLPAEVMADYSEAASILSKSPRASAALLRLAIQKLCAHLGGKGENLNDDIAMLVKRGLPEQVQQALDIVRVTGNNAVHPGQMDVDDIAIAGDLFELVNLIAEYMISMPKRVQASFSRLPAGTRDAIARRDLKA